MKPVGLLSAVILVLGAGILVLTEQGAAHARLVRADPSPGATVRTAPKMVRLWFKLSGVEELDPQRSAVSVWDQRGKRVDDGKGGVDLDDLDRKSIIARLRPVGPGVYTVRWKAVSAPDGNVLQGRFQFTVAKGG